MSAQSSDSTFFAQSIAPPHVLLKYKKTSIAVPVRCSFGGRLKLGELRYNSYHKVIRLNLFGVIDFVDTLTYSLAGCVA